MGKEKSNNARRRNNHASLLPYGFDLASTVGWQTVEPYPC